MAMEVVDASADGDVTTHDLSLHELQQMVEEPTYGSFKLRDPAWLTRLRLYHRQTTRVTGRDPPAPPCGQPLVRLPCGSLFGDPNILGARTLWPLPAFERHRLTFAQFVEADAATGRLVKEVLVAVACRNETESLVRQPFDRAIHHRHSCLVEH
jgi:hypothetical protein